MAEWVCGRDNKHPEPLDANELDGVRQGMDVYRSDELVARLLATVDQLRPALVRANDWFQDIPEQKWKVSPGWRQLWDRDSEFIRGALGEIRR